MHLSVRCVDTTTLVRVHAITPA